MWGISLTRVIALASVWWGGPPGPRRTPSSACWQAGQGAGRGRPPHIAPQNAGYLSQADTPQIYLLLAGWAPASRSAAATRSARSFFHCVIGGNLEERWIRLHSEKRTGRTW